MPEDVITITSGFVFGEQPAIKCANVRFTQISLADALLWIMYMYDEEASLDILGKWQLA